MTNLLNSKTVSTAVGVIKPSKELRDSVFRIKQQYTVTKLYHVIS
jgi:hypothetical protein